MTTFDFNFSRKQDTLVVFEVDTNLTFRKRKKNNSNSNNDNDQSPIKSITEEFNNEDKLTRIINHIAYQLSDVINQYNLNFTVIALNVQNNILLDEQMA